MLPEAFINEGDVTLMTAPGYPIMATHTDWNGGRTVKLPLTEENNFLPDLAAISAEDRAAAKLLYLNYPNNPTGATATREFFEEVVRFAKENNIIVVQDAAYAALTIEAEPLSFLSIDGAKDVGVEIHSCSKAYNMTGWRLAFLVGNELIINAFAHVKDNFDSGQFIAIQKAGVYALNHPEITGKIRGKYKRRLRLMVDALNDAGFDARMPGGSFYLYVKAPKSANKNLLFEKAEDASEYLIKEALISTVPWDDAGNFLRFSATFSAKGEADERRVIEEMGRRLKELRLHF
jgi:LL-diaminopimelate aminotransferase